jgi:RNA polymerase sigma factor (sigma-70 family)
MTEESTRGAVSAYRAVICRLEDQMDGSDGQLTDLVDRAAGGDQDAWNGITERFGNLVWAVARSYRLSTADAADVAQTTWLRLVEQLGRIRDPERLAGWLATTARHESLSILRRSGRERGWRSVDEIHDRVDAHSPPVDLHLLEDERDVQLWRSFEQLPERCQTLLRVLMAYRSVVVRGGRRRARHAGRIDRPDPEAMPGEAPGDPGQLSVSVRRQRKPTAMTRDATPSDDDLLARLGAIARVVDPVPPLVADMAQAALGLRALDAELAALINDSAVEAAATRAPGDEVQLLEFETPSLAIAVQISSDQGPRSMLGQLTSTQTPVEVTVAIESSSGERTPEIPVDSQGRFSWPDLPGGAIRLHCTRPDGSAVVTPWIPSAGPE